MSTLLNYNGSLVMCGSGAFVKGMDCEFVSFPEANDWNWRVVEELNGVWNGIDGNSPSFQWTACGGGALLIEGSDESNCCGGNAFGESFSGIIETTIIFFCKKRLILSCSGDVETKDPGFDDGTFEFTQKGGTVYQTLIASSGGDIPCMMTNKSESDGVDVECCGKLTLMCRSGDSNHHTPGQHDWTIDYQ